MTVRRVDETVLLEGVCAVEDAELLMQQLQFGGQTIDWSGCTHLHTACLQVLLTARVKLHGKPANPALERWIPQLLDADDAPEQETTLADSQPACLVET